MAYAVEMLGITKVFKKLKANDKVDFRLKKGSIHGLLGENGAGKTTLMNILFGLYRPDGGQIIINEKCCDIPSPQRAMGMGIGMVHQHFMLARPMTVTQNIMLGMKSKKAPFLDTKRVAGEIAQLCSKYNMNIDPNAKIWQLSVGEQQRVEILSAIYRGADILVLDEPTAVLTPQESDELFDILRSMRDDGKSIILITHKLEEVLSVVDEVTVLRDGKLVGSREITPEVTKADLTKMMVGREILFDFEDTAACVGDVKIQVKNICVRNNKGLPALNNLSLEIKSGEILGLAGVDGNGQKELAEVMTGLRKAVSGEIIFKDKNIVNRRPIKYIEDKIAHVPEDRQSTGIAMNLSIKNNLIIKNFSDQRFSGRWIMKRKAVEEYADKLISKYKIKTGSKGELAKNLSGGNQQKIVLAREISSHPEVLIVSHPTRGLDIGASEYVRDQLIKQKAKGVATLLISADLEEILQLSDRIAVIYDGQITGILPRGAAVNDIGRLMLGQVQYAN